MAPLTRRRKRVLAAAATPPVIHPADRLSRLPDEVLAQILSFLPAQEAMRTCVLARAWRDVWKSTRQRTTGGTVQEVREFVDRLLRLRLNELKCASLDECEIMIGMHDNHDTRCTVNRWIDRSLECQVQAFRVLNERQVPHLMSDRPLISQHLTRLELSGLWFECINLNLDGCPVLEHLEINKCYLAGARKIMSPSLKRLVITEYDSNEGYPSFKSFKISAPCLVSLWLDVGAFRALLLESMPELVEAHVRIDSYCWRHMGWVFLEGLAQAKDLVLLAQHSMFRKDLGSCPTFSYLKDLVLNGYWCEPADCRALACILEHAPVLEKLTVLFSEKVELEYDIVLEGRPDATAKSTMTTQCLKTVKVKCNTVHEGVRNVLKFLSTLNICLYAEVDKEQLVEGANLILMLAKGLLTAQHTRHGDNLQLLVPFE